MATDIWVNSVSCNGLLPDGTKPFHEAMLTNLMAFGWGKFHRRWPRYLTLIWVWNLPIQYNSICRGQWVNSRCTTRYRYITLSILNNIVWSGYIDGLVQERRNSSADALELRLSCTKTYRYEINNSRRNLIQTLRTLLSESFLLMTLCYTRISADANWPR